MTEPRTETTSPATWSLDRHPFQPADDRISCVHCNLPRGNRRHTDPSSGDAA